MWRGEWGGPRHLCIRWKSTCLKGKGLLLVACIQSPALLESFHDSGNAITRRQCNYRDNDVAADNKDDLAVYTYM